MVLRKPAFNAGSLKYKIKMRHVLDLSLSQSAADVKIKW